MQDDFDHNLPEEDKPAYDPSGDMLEKMHVADDAQSVEDAKRFTPEQKTEALDRAAAYIEKHGEVDQLVVGRLTSNVGPDYGVMRKIIADPITGRGDARGPGYDDPLTWPLPPTHPSPRPSAADKMAQRKLEAAIEELAKRERQDHIDDLARRAREEAQATIRGDLGPEDMETLKKVEDYSGEHPQNVNRKDTNPKDAVGIRKWRVFTTVPFTIIWELGVAMMEGARKYGRHNYRVAGVRGSVYIDAAMGHLTQWWEGEDNDLDTGLSHITKAMASLCVLRDAMIQGKFVDDRPPKTDVAAVRDELQARMDEVFERIPTALPAYVEGDQHDTQD